MNLTKIMSWFFVAALFVVCGCGGGESNFDKAQFYQKDGEYKKAVEFYKRAIQKRERIAESEKYLGDIYLGDKNFDETFEHYKKSIEQDPNVALETVMKYISYNDAKVRDKVGEMLAGVENDEAKEKINDALSQILNSKDQYKIIDALAVISKMKERAFPLTDDIFKLLDENNSIIKQKILDVLPNIAKIVSEKYGLDKLISFLKQKDEIIKISTIDCLGNMRGYAIGTLPSLIEVAVKEPRYGKNVFPAIEKMGLPTKEQMRNMYSILKDKPKEIKIKMLNIWGNFGDKANSYVPYILVFLNDEDNEVKKATRDALSKIGKASQESIPDLINLLKENNDEILSRAIYELGDLGKAASAAIEPLKEIADKTQSREVKTNAHDALQKIQ